MSHVVTVEAVIKDLGALAQAAQALGMELVRDQKTFKWWGRHVGDYPLPQGYAKEDMGKCEHAIRLKGQPNAYEIGVVRRRDGQPGWTLMFDFYGGGRGLMAAVGEGAQRLLQEYTVAQVQKTVAKTHRVQRELLPDGRIKLTLGS